MVKRDRKGRAEIGCGEQKEMKLKGQFKCCTGKGQEQDMRREDRRGHAHFKRGHEQDRSNTEHGKAKTGAVQERTEAGQ
jgi:hypothetical protein